MDYENRLAEASTRKQKVRYRYDALGRRVTRNLGGGREVTKFTYGGEDVLVDDNFVTQTKYLNGTGIDNKIRSTTGSTTSYFLADHLGSTNGLANSSGALTASNGYDSFGNPTNAAFSSRYQFTGREFDNFSGLQYSRARFYDPNLGRFISEDPIGFEGGDVNLYGYVSNNPLNYYDPSGLFPFTPSEAADSLDISLNNAQNTCGCDVPLGFSPFGGMITLFGAAHGTVDWLRVGNGVGHALYANDENGYGRAAYAGMDIVRGAGIFTTLAGPFAPKTGGAPFDKFSRDPKGLMDQMVLDAAKNGAGEPLRISLGDPRFSGMQKCSYSVKSEAGALSEVHYVRDPKTGNVFDFKFKHHAERYR
ncbi:MAG: RHS repeat domain-containing protein [Pyrinomonadaceae bacterium]